MLLEYPGQVVTKGELHRRIWGAETSIDFDHSLGIAINKLREALGDSAENPRFIETLARRGYRLIAPVTIEPSAAAEQQTDSEPRPARVSPTVDQPQNGRIQRKWTWLLPAIVLGAFLLIDRFRPVQASLRSIRQVTNSGQVLEPSVTEDRVSSPVTDGARLYFSHLDSAKVVLAGALIGNGEIQEYKLPSEIRSPIISAISPDQDSLLIHNALIGDPEQPMWTVPTNGGKAFRIGNVLAHDATWMPDGKQILYASGDTLFTAQPDGANARKFADLPGQGFWLRWSPDGKHLRLSVNDRVHQTASLWEISANGEGLHPLLQDWNQPPSECCGNWTPDGRYFVFQSHRSGRNNLWMRDEGLFSGHQPRKLTDGPLDFQAPVSSPQGHRIFFIGSNQNVNLFQLVPNTSRFVSIEGTLSLAVLAEFSHDGEWVAWLNREDGSLWRSRSDGSERLQLTSGNLRVFMMRWSSDNKRIAIMAEDPGHPWKIYIAASDGGALAPLLLQDKNEADPNWSADGETIIFGRPPEAMSSDSQPKAIYIADIATRKVAEIPGSAGLFSPRLSPDGRYVAALTVSDRNLMLYDRNGGKWNRITDHAVADPQWAHTSRELFFQNDLEDGKPIYRLDVATGNMRPVAALDGLRPLNALDYRLIGLSREDLPIVSASTSTVNLYSMDLDK